MANLEYFILKPDGEQTGTFSLDQVRAMIEKGTLPPETRYWHEGIIEWRPIGQIEESVNFQPPVSTEPKRTSFPPRKPPAISREVKSATASGKTALTSTASSLKKITDRLPSIAPAIPVDKEAAPRPETAPRTVEPAAPSTTPPQPTKPVVTWKNHLLNWVGYAASVIVAALVITYIGPVVHHFSSGLKKNVTLTPDETYVLLNQAALKPFAEDMRNFPTADSLRHQMEQTADPNTRMGLQIGLEKALKFHADEVKQHYLQNRMAKVIDPGTYQLVNNLDDKGESSLLSSDNSVWIAISYQDQTVYAFNPAGWNEAAKP